MYAFLSFSWELRLCHTSLFFCTTRLACLLCFLVCNPYGSLTVERSLCFLSDPGFHSFFLSTVNSDLSAELRIASGQLMADDLSLVSAGGMGGMSSSDPSLSSLSPPINDPSLRLYQCAVCNCFSTDSLEALNAHVNAERSLPEEEWRCVLGDVYQCKLCSYNTQLKANFQLHCKTDKHMQKHQLVAHIKEGGKANQWRLKCVAIGNPVHLKCNACDYYSNSVDKLRLHATNQRHEAVIRLYKVKKNAF